MIDIDNDDQFDVIKEFSNPLASGGRMTLDMDDEDDTLKTSTDLSKSKDKDNDNVVDDDDKQDDVKNTDSSDDKDVDDDTGDDVVDDKDDSGTDISELGEFESDIASYVASKLSDKLGEDLGSFDTVDTIVDKLAEIVEENSIPEFANEEVQKIDEYVRNGGDLRKYYEEIYDKRLNPEDIDLDEVSDQKRIIKENLKNSGYSQTQISKKLDRYEETGVLKEEAEDALELVKEFNEKTEKKLLEKQKNLMKEQTKVQQKFVSDVQDYIKGLKEVAGIPITDKQKAELLKYSLMLDKEGKTAYQKDYEKDLTKQYVLSAFFTKYNDTLLEKVEKKGASKLAQELQQKFSQKGKRIKKSISQSEMGDVDPLDLAAGQLVKVRRR